MRHLILSPLDNRDLMSRNTTSNMASEIRAKLEKSGYRATLYDTQEKAWRIYVDAEEIEHLATSSPLRGKFAKLIEKSISANAPILVFNFLGFTEKAAAETLALAYLAAFAWPHVVILVDADDNGHYHAVKDMLEGAPNAPPVYTSVEAYLEALAAKALAKAS